MIHEYSCNNKTSIKISYFDIIIRLKGSNTCNLFRRLYLLCLRDGLSILRTYKEHNYTLTFTFFFFFFVTFQSDLRLYFNFLDVLESKQTQGIDAKRIKKKISSICSQKESLSFFFLSYDLVSLFFSFMKRFITESENFFYEINLYAKEKI